MDEKQELQTTLKEIQGGAGGGTERSGIDVSGIQKQIRNLDAAIEHRTAEAPRAVQKDKLVKEEQDLEDAIAEGMPTKYEMDQPSKNPGAVRKHLAWLQRNNPRIERYVQIQRILRPMEPKSIESLRKDR